MEDLDYRSILVDSGIIVQCNILLKGGATSMDPALMVLFLQHIRPKIPENPPFLKRVFDKQILTHHQDWQLPFPLTCGVIWIALIKKNV